MIDVEELCRKAMQEDTLEALDAAAYGCGFWKPNYPVPAVVYETVFPWEERGYCDMIFIDEMGDPEDPVMKACWDFHISEKPEWQGKYQRCYTDAETFWYEAHGVQWRG